MAVQDGKLAAVSIHQKLAESVASLEGK
jgi:hypothetical protein